MARSTRVLVSVLSGALALAPHGARSEAEEATPAATNEEVLLVLGEQRVLDAESVESFSESTRGVIEVKVPRDGRRIVITAIRPGSTSLLLMGKGGGERTLLITVFARRPEAIAAELDGLLGQLDVELKRAGPRIFIDGAVPTDGDKDRIERLAKLYDGQVASLVRVDAGAVRSRTNVRLDLSFVELRHRDGYNAGISWPGSFGATGALSGSLNILSGDLSATYEVVDQALPALEAAARSGFARIRKRATVMTVSGHRATYEAGGEVNVAVAGSQAAELRSVPYGARLAVTPRLAADDSGLDLDVEAEVSDLTETTQNVPGRTISKVATLVHLGLSQSIMLSGLDAESETGGTEGLPLLSKIPILGFFFGTRNRAEERVEGVILITPSVIDSVDDVGRRLLEQALARFAKFQGDFDDLEEKE